MSSSAADRASGTPETLVRRVFIALADGAVHSGEHLAAAQAVSRSAIWKAVGALQELGLNIEAAPHRGYRLAGPITPLDATRIVAELTPALREHLRSAEVAWSVPSTNSALLARAEPPVGQFDFLLAEYQSAGRGRRARQWFAPPGGALCLSIGWSYAALPRGAAALSLAIGVCARRALQVFAGVPVQLKWPNDLLAGERKLGGILIELRAESSGPAYVVIGVGINCALGAALSRRVQDAGTLPTDLAALGVIACDRNRLAAILVSEIIGGVVEFERHGLAPFATEWNAADALVGRTVKLTLPDCEYLGLARGIDAEGALCVQGADAIRHFHSGEVSVRAQ
ncbi:MAG TPA: biotin--[acetyl-CoA-carboxylase] ligase [Steroidobacteraceae bacterium]|nr:biotin--[acetyl-CoA-carboxylase] ligase [Steroidobacteraceae bacterium]